MIKITKRIFLIVLAVFLFNIAKSQCVINAQATLNSMPFTDTVKLCLGQTIELQSQGTCAFLMNNDFNNQTLGTGWSSTLANPVFNNPCQCPFVGGQPPDTCAGNPGQLGPNGTFAWVGTTASVERTLITPSYNLTPFIATGGCKIKFWMMFGITSGSGSCEDPDALDEGVHLQYSVNNGTTWTDFPGPNTNPVGNLSPTPPFNTITPGSGGYWAPQSALTAQLQSTVYFWNRYQVNLPNNIYTNNTKFRWAQLATSSTGYDAWGIDEVEIVCNAALNTTINWTSNGNQVGTGFNIQVTPTQSSWYLVTIKDTSVTPAIYAKDSVYVQVFPNPTSDFTVVSPICSDYSSNIVFTGTASNQAVYNWTFGGNTLAYTGNGSGPYNVTWNPPAVGEDSTINTVSLIVVDQNNCTSPQKDLEVIVYKLPNAFAGNDTSVCFGDSIKLTATGGATYLWNNGVAQGISFVPQTTSTYLVNVTSVNGCSSKDSLIINVNPVPAVPTITQNGFALLSSSATNNQWFSNGTPVAGATSQIYNVTVSGFYSVQVSNNYGCKSMSTIINVGLGIDDNVNNSITKVYPNPVSNELIIEIEGNKEILDFEILYKF